MKLYRVHSNLSERFEDQTDDISVTWLNVPSDTGRFEQHYPALVNGYRLATEVAPPDKAWETIQDNDHESIVATSLWGIINAQLFIEEHFTEAEARRVCEFLAVLDCKIEMEEVILPVSIEDAVPLFDDSIPHVWAEIPGADDTLCVSYVERGTVDNLGLAA